jgi:hypothetical protein
MPLANTLVRDRQRLAMIDGHIPILTTLKGKGELSDDKAAASSVARNSFAWIRYAGAKERSRG